MVGVPLQVSLLRNCANPFRNSNYTQIILTRPDETYTLPYETLRAIFAHAIQRHKTRLRYLCFSVSSDLQGNKNKRVKLLHE